MSCKDCIHYKACMHTRTAILDPYQACLSDNDTEECSDWFTTDVQEVKHAKWVEQVKIRKNGEVRLVHWQCSLCGCFLGTNTANYCPNCGAKMDLEENENEH